MLIKIPMDPILLENKAPNPKYNLLSNLVQIYLSRPISWLFPLNKSSALVKAKDVSRIIWSFNCVHVGSSCFFDSQSIQEMKQ